MAAAAGKPKTSPKSVKFLPRGGWPACLRVSMRQATYTTTRLGIYTILFEKAGLGGRAAPQLLRQELQ
uniref:Uncharacterized protein n=1 Tax=Sphaerodactylus townsendi TaxID=933632 RepID=A0ACB8EXQ3_9SAUR